MSLFKDQGNHVFLCDGSRCHETLETYTPNWSSALNILALRGWKARRNRRLEWEHFCSPECEGRLV